jgi:hypothetical protein
LCFQQQIKAAGNTRICLLEKKRELTLGVGWSLAGTLETWLFAFLDARIASQVSTFAHGSV